MYKSYLFEKQLFVCIMFGGCNRRRCLTEPVRLRRWKYTEQNELPRRPIFVTCLPTKVGRAYYLLLHFRLGIASSILLQAVIDERFSFTFAFEQNTSHNFQDKPYSKVQDNMVLEQNTFVPTCYI